MGIKCEYRGRSEGEAVVDDLAAVLSSLPPPRVGRDAVEAPRRYTNLVVEFFNAQVFVEEENILE